MKKTSTKLQLKTKTIRLLQQGELARVNGGAPTHDPQLCRIGLQWDGGNGDGGEPV
jgi:hypothetical protein